MPKQQRINKRSHEWFEHLRERGVYEPFESLVAILEKFPDTSNAGVYFNAIANENDETYDALVIVSVDVDTYFCADTLRCLLNIFNEGSLKWRCSCEGTRRVVDDRILTRFIAKCRLSEIGSDDDIKVETAYKICLAKSNLDTIKKGN